MRESEYPEAYRRLFKEARGRRKKAIRNLETFLMAQAFEKEFSTKEIDIYPRVDFWGDVSIQVNNITHSKEIAKLLRWLVQQDYHQITKASIVPENSCIFYDFSKVNGDQELHLDLRVYLSAESNCRAVVIGQDTRTTPKYKLVCS